VEPSLKRTMTGVPGAIRDWAEATPAMGRVATARESARAVARRSALGEDMDVAKRQEGGGLCITS
jgi:hypothetical protein